MTHSWEDSLFDVTNPDLGLLMPDCPAELSIQSHSLMLNVRRSVQLSRSKEGTASPWSQVSREAKLLRRVKSFQQPAVSTSIVPTLSRIRSFFDFSREDTAALDSEVPSILPRTGNFYARGLDEDDSQNAEEEEEEVGSNEAPASSDVKPNFEGAAEAHLNRDVEEALCANGNEFDKPVTGSAGTAKVDVNETMKKFESAFGEALYVGSLKIDVRERIKRIQTAFEGFIPWDSGTGKPRGELSDVVAVGSVKPVIMVTTAQSDAGNEVKQGSNIKGMKGELHDSSIGFGGQACNLGFVCTDKESSVELNQEQIIRSMEEGGLDNLNQVDEVQIYIPKDAAIESPAPNGTDDEVKQERATEDMEDGGSCILIEVKEVASGTEVVNPTLSESDAYSQEETLSMENEEAELSSVDEVDEVQAVILNLGSISPRVAVRETFGELKHVTVNSDTIEERVVECHVTRDSSCRTAASKSVGVQCDVVSELMEEIVVHEELPQLSGRLDVTEGSGYTPVVNMVDDASGELNQIVKEMNGKGCQDSSWIDKVQADLCWEIATWNSEYLDVDNIVNTISPKSTVDDLPFHDEADKLDVHEQEVICKVMCDKGVKDWNEVDNARPNALWESVSALPLDTQIAADSDLTQDIFAKEMKANGLRKPNIKVDWVQPEAGADSMLSDKETTDISGLPSPLSQLLDYRNGSAFTFLNVQDHLPDVGDCLLHDEEEICYIQPGYLSREIDLRSLSSPCDSWCSQKELISQSNGVENSDTGRSKGTINLRRLRIRKSVCLKALKASSSKMRNRMSDAEIADRLEALAPPEDLKVEEGAVSLIASRSNSSTDDAETKSDKLSLVDMKVPLTSVQVQKHVGLLPDRELLSLLNFALSADRANTTKMVNEILGSSVEPLLLVSQLGVLITNILVENYDVHREARKGGICRPSYSRKQTQRRLRQALKILSEAEKYVRVSTDSMTWLTAALLQCESDRPFPPSTVGSLAETLMTPKSKEQRLEMLVSTDVGTAENEINTTEVSKLGKEETHEGHGVRSPKQSELSSNILEPPLEKNSVMYQKELKGAWALEAKEAEEHKQVPNVLNSQEAPVSENFPVLEELDSSKLWKKVLQGLTSSNLKHLLLTQGRLVSAGTASDGSRVIVEVEFQYAVHKHKAERSWRSICSAFQSVLRIPIELKISLKKNVFDEGQLARNLDGVDGEERDLLTQHLSRLNQEAEVVSYSTDSHCGSHSKRRRRRAQKDWQFEELVEPERKSRHRSDSWSMPEPMQLTPRYKGRERPSAGPTGEWHNYTLGSSFSGSQEQHSGHLQTIQSRLPVGGKIKRPRLRTMLGTPLNESDTIQDIRSNAPEQIPAEFRTDRDLPIEAVCFPCTRRTTQFRQKPTYHVEDRRQGDSMDRRGRAQGQTFFLRLLPCKSISTVRL